MDITKIPNTNRVILNMQTTNKAGVIEELTSFLKKDGMIDCRETSIRDVQQRETEGSIGFEDHIVIPHGKLSAVANATPVISRIRQDIPRGTLDGSSVRCIILFVARLKDQNTTHIRLLPRVAGMLVSDDIVEQLLVEMGLQKTIDLLSQYT